MREELVGYLLGALEPDEERELEARLAAEESLRSELEELKQLLQPLLDERKQSEHCVLDPPQGLADRICNKVWHLREAAVAEATTACDGGLSRSETFTLLALVVVAAALTAPLFGSARQMAEIRRCQENMHRTGRALIEYARLHDDAFPEIAESGSTSYAGIFAVRLRESGLLPDADAAFCRAALDDGLPMLPTSDELAASSEAEAEATFAALGGLFGYTLGYEEDGRYRRQRNRNRARFAVLVDDPLDARNGGRSHGCGQNVCFEDGHVEFLKSCKLPKSCDDYFRNHDGVVAAGIGPDDVVLGRSSATPRIRQASFERTALAPRELTH